MRKSRTGNRQAGRRKLDAQLDEALEHTFPASDPISIGHATATEPPARPVDRKAPTIDKDELATARKRHQRRSGR
jgi:hypothetical protein